MNYEERCQHCGECDFNGLDCMTCGFGLELPLNQYETPSGNIVTCTEEEAFDNGYITKCPHCGDTILWWEMEDHGSCITCWHVKNKSIDN